MQEWFNSAWRHIFRADNIMCMALAFACAMPPSSAPEEVALLLSR